ncbi:ATP-dependent Clp protease proteolytic subunit [Hymenobacter aerilatus]|uniref:ATP-dependent Clp protease proteolytic subunit n=1 Tax=Hymenobacter aerilatus TaxID=2932251 RepID=A0A8T9SXY2_9BACT|nr:ATP-dependent Clp protease proteolytic subunit [Hymenobacter aerilatus]UOR06241.1 ATP-dependent Clp protease proteolytic subunit [Hymenobacter aerilatus]
MAEAKVYISGPIVADSAEAEASGYGYPYTTLEDVTMQLEWQKPFDSVRVVINSPGGRVDVGLGIYDYLRSLPGVTITTEALGQCSSIATAIMLAGSVRLIHQHTVCLVHLPRGGVIGATASEAQKWADEMAACQQKIIDLYVARTGRSEEEMAAVMAQEVEQSADSMLSLGFATQIVQPVTALAIAPPKNALVQPKPAAASSDSALTTMAKGFTDFLKSIKDAVTNLETAAKTNLSVTTTGDAPVTLTIDTGDRDTYAEGDAVTDAEGNAVADNSYALTDGNTITTAAGAITSIVATENTDSATNTADAEGVTQLAEAVTALAGVVTNLAKDVQAMKQDRTAITNLTNKVNSLVKSGGKVNLDDNAETRNTTSDTTEEGKTADQLAADRRAARNSKK